MHSPPARALVLVVDDEPAIRAVLTILLADEGYRVISAADGQEALDHLAHHRPDVIVSDIRMPRLHGLAMVERLRADGLATPVILVSSCSPHSNLPGVRFIAKPFDLDHITAAVAACLANA